MHDGSDAALAAVLLAIDPPGLGGALLRGDGVASAEGWIAAVAALLPEGVPVRQMPPGTGVERLVGGLDVVATLASGRVEAERGLLAGAAGGLLVVPLAERLDHTAVAVINSVLDRRRVRVERDGIGREDAAAVGVVAIEEGDDRVAEALRDRLALVVEPAAADAPGFAAAAVAAARRRLRDVRMEPDDIAALCVAAHRLGVGSNRASLHALAAARASAALGGRARPDDDDLALAARLVLGPRATRLPEAPPADPPSDPATHPDESSATAGDGGLLADRLVEAAQASLPSHLLTDGVGGGRAGRRGGGREVPAAAGRRLSAREGRPGGGRRLDLLATLRAAAPWQGLRGRAAGSGGRVRVRAADLRIRRHVRKAGTTMVFVVDASGSTAWQRLAEAKGAVELLLAESYVRRDRVALVAFRGRGAELLLPPTRAPARARRALAALPGGGGTPLASGLDAGRAVAAAATRSAEGDPLLVLLTDGRPNVARDGTGGRPRAEAEALEAAGMIRREGCRAVVIDTGRVPGAFAARLADAMGATYLPLPGADAERMRGAVLAARGSR